MLFCDRDEIFFNVIVNDGLRLNYTSINVTVCVTVNLNVKVIANYNLIYFATVTQKIFYNLVDVLYYDDQMAGCSSYCHNQLPHYRTLCFAANMVIYSTN